MRRVIIPLSLHAIAAATGHRSIDTLPGARSNAVRTVVARPAGGRKRRGNFLRIGVYLGVSLSRDARAAPKRGVPVVVVLARAARVRPFAAGLLGSWVDDDVRLEVEGNGCHNSCWQKSIAEPRAGETKAMDDHA